ncbi:MAG: hypothetical protein LC659_08835 [Myxococcales bacterium]|nr:hypothetical protein [Myxococcales bacterium]
MIDVTDVEKIFSSSDEDDIYDVVEFDPECTSVDDEIDNDTLAFRDAVRDIWVAEGRFDLIVP